MSEASLPRGTVTFLFSDIEGSTDLVRRVGDEVFAEIRVTTVGFCATRSRRKADGRSTWRATASSSLSIAPGGQ